MRSGVVVHSVTFALLDDRRPISYGGGSGVILSLSSSCYDTTSYISRHIRMHMYVLYVRVHERHERE